MHESIDETPEHELTGGVVDVITRMEAEVLHATPIARDLNRHITDLLGVCPVTDDGQWLTLVEQSPGEYCVALPMLPLHEALRLSTALNHIDEIVGLSKIKQGIPASISYKVDGLFTLLTADLSNHVHVEVPR